jgi:glycosyltransferase involved in cell wall biosynthesis
LDLHVIFLSDTDPSRRPWHTYANEARFSYRVLRSWRTKLGGYDVLLNQKVVDSLWEAAPHVLVCGGYNYLASWQAQRWANRSGVPFLLWSESTAQDQRPGHALVESLKQTFFRRCDGFIVPGTSAREYISQMKSATGRIFTAPNAVDVELFSSCAEAARKDSWRVRGALGLPERYFLFVGRLIKAKGVLELLQAYASLSDQTRSEVGLVFAGDGPMRPELESLAQCIYPGAVHFTGFLHRNDLARCYGLGECLVFPTHSDTWGMVVNEAIACGLPVICSRVAGCARDLVTTNGLLVEPQDVAQLARAMGQVAADPKLRNKFSMESREIRGRYSPEMCAEGIAQAAGTVFRRKDVRSEGARDPRSRADVTHRSPPPYERTSVNNQSQGAGPL